MSDAIRNIWFPCGTKECLYVSNKLLAISPDLLFCALQLLSFNFFKKHSRHDNNYECMLLADMQHSHPHITMYWEVTFFSWGGRILRKVVSMMIILLSLSLASFSTPSSGVLTIILWSSRAETYNNHFGINCFSESLSIET